MPRNNLGARLLGLCLLALCCSSPLSAQLTPEQRAWLQKHAHGLESVEAGNGFEDLAPLQKMIGNARVVGLGEGTHGTREHFQAKHRLLEYLVTQLGFTIFSIEANMPESYALNDYVLGGDGDVEDLISGMYFWTWNTHEVRDMVEWMRAYNADQSDPKKRVQFTGFDMQTETVALRIVRDYLKAHAGESGKQHLTALSNLKKLDTSRGAGFGVFSGMFPVEVARGKKIKFSGWIKTENLEGGWAGLWWRVDGPTAAFDNMEDRGPRGTEDWKQYAIELDVPEDAEGIVFGLIMPGTGKSWFDGLRIEVDGEEWSNEDFDLDFEAPQLKGLFTRTRPNGSAFGGYRSFFDDEAKVGEQCIRFEGTPPDEDALDPAEAAKVTQAVVDYLDQKKPQLVQATTAKDAEWALQNARVVHQWVGLATAANGSAHRDLCMADNVDWILEQNPEAKVVLWAHNWHVRNEQPWMGAHLRERHGENYINLAFCSSYGQYHAMKQGGGGRGEFPLAQPPKDSFEAYLEADGRPRLLVDLRAAKASDPASGWLKETRPFGGIIGAMEMPNHYHATDLAAGFDLLIYIRDTTPARQLGR